MGERSRRGMARVAVAGLVGSAALLAPSRSASAACHAFTVQAEPAVVGEGAEVTVTVSRDANVGPSQIDVETIDSTASGGSDYEAVDRRTVSFTSETEQSFTVATMADTEVEASETFRLHLSNPGGCSVNPNFVVGPDAEVTITDDDLAATTAPTAPPSTARPSTSAARPQSSTTFGGATSSSLATTTSTSVATSSTAAVDDIVAAPAGENDDDGGTDIAPALIAIVVLLAAAGAGGWAWRARRTRP